MELTAAAAAAAMDGRREERRRRGRAVVGRARETKGLAAQAPAIGAPRPRRVVGVAGKGVEEKQAIAFQPRRASRVY